MTKSTTMMNRKRSRAQARSGAVLGMVLIAMVMVSLLGMGMLRMNAITGLEAGKTVSSAQAFWTAEAGLERAKAIAQKRRVPMNKITLASSPTGFLYGSNVLSGTTARGSYSVDVVDDPAWTNATKALKKYIIRARGTSSGGKTHTISLKAEIRNYASYMHASNWERVGSTLIYFQPGDVIDGPVYVNDRLNINGGSPNPIFRQLVSSATNTVNYINGANSNVFQAGLALNATPLDISGQFTSNHIEELEAEASQPDGLTLSGDYQLIFKPDGTVTYYPRSGGATNTRYLSSMNGAIYVDGDAWVQGTVNGQATVAAQDTIYISNSVVYASATNPSPWQAGFVTNNVDDALGLMAYNRLEIRGTNTVNVHAAVMITNGDDGFGAENRYVNIGGNKYINLYGSLSQYRRGIVSRVSGSTFQGFRKNYKFDARFNYDAPPSFPYSVYAFSGWQQSGI